MSITTWRIRVSDPPFARRVFSEVGGWSFVWLAMRVWLGWQWLLSGWHKVMGHEGWGPEELREFWVRALAAPVHSVGLDVAYDWYHAILRFFLEIGLEGWFAPLTAWGELFVGLALIAGAFVGIAAAFGIFLNMNFLLAGSAATDPLMLLGAILLVLAWKTAGWYGLDRWLLPKLGTPWSHINVLLRQKETVFRQLYEDMFHHAPLGLLVLTPQGEIDFLNEKMRDLFGAERLEDLLGASIFSIASYESSGLLERIRQGLRGEPFTLAAVDYRFGDSKRHTALRFQGVPVRDEDGNVTRLLLLAEDITIQKHAEEALFHQTKELAEAKAELEKQVAMTQKFEQAVDASTDALSITTPEAEIIYVNPAWERLNGYVLQEVRGKNPNILHSGKTPADVYREMWATLTRGRSFTSEEVINRRKDGTEYRERLTIAPIQEGGKILFYVGLTQDITERKKIEAMKSDFVSLVSHQLRTPTAMIRGYAENMLAGLTGELTPKQREYLEAIRDIAKEHFQLILGLLNVSRIERGAITVERANVDLRNIVAMAMRDYEQEITRRGLRRESAGLQQPLMVYADAEKTIEALRNVIDNAVKFTQHGSVAIRAKSTGGAAELEVTDTGKGMNESELSHLFEKDYVLSGGPSADGAGAHLGLYIAKHFMQLQGGDLGARSQPGKGSTFTFTIPLARVR